MVDSPPPQNSTLNPSETPYSFPPHRRRPLRSRTYGTLIQILPLCRTSCSQLKLQEPVSKEDGSITCNEPNSTDVLVPLPNNKGSNETIVQEDFNDENKENTGFPDGGFDDKEATNLKLHHIDSVSDGQQEVTSSNGISVEDFFVVENQMGDFAIQNPKEQENVNSVLDIQVDDFEVDKEFCIGHFSEVLEACFGMDMDVESSKEGEDSQDKGAVLKNSPKDAEQELQLKEMELEKLIHNSGGMEPSFHLNVDEEIEEGEISGEAGESIDVLSDDAASLGERTKEKMHASEAYFDGEKLFRKEEDRGGPQHETSNPSLVNMVNGDSNSMMMESRTPAKQMEDCFSENILYDYHMESQRSGAITPCLKNLTPPGRFLQENAAENQVSRTTEKDAIKKKRKRGPSTKEKRDKKKKKERLKRAENNRKLGVKRLKLQPVLKPKKIVYCRHYLQGRCHEGDKCNFSHDTVPLTKSKPCSHFARHSCMKGDDCPFDHDLSKYPCTNYASNGFCNRGSECLFSHEMPAKSCSVTPNVFKPDLMCAQHTVASDKGRCNPTSKLTKPDLKFLSLLNNSNSSKHMDNHGVLHQTVDPRFCSAPGQSAELLAAKPVPRTGGQPPRGVSFLLNMGILGDTNKDKQDGSSTKKPDCGGVAILKVPDGISELNKMPEVAAPRKPWGINFLSFGQPPADISRGKIFSNLLSNSNNGAHKSVIDDMGECGSVKVNKQMNPSTTNLASDLNEKVNGTPLTVPQHANMSFNRTHLDDSISKETTNLHFSKGDTALSFVEERPSTSKLQDTVKMPSLSFGGLCDQLTSGQNVNLSRSFNISLSSNTPSSVQKAVQSTLAFAAKLEPDIKVGSSLHHQVS